MKTEVNLKWLYSKKVEKQIYDALEYANTSGRIKVHEYRNTTDIDIIPLIRKLIERNVKVNKLGNNQMMAQILKQEVYCEKGKLKHLVKDKKMERYILELENNLQCEKEMMKND